MHSYAPAAPVYGSAGGSAYGGSTAYAHVSFLGWIRNFAISGLVLGGLFGLARAVMLHVPAGLTGMIVLRLAIAGAAAGAGIPPAFRALSTMFRAFLWIVLATGLWMIALAAAGQWDWLNRLH